MNTTFKNFLCFFLLVFYSVGATIGNIVVLRDLLNSGDSQHQFTSEKKSRSLPETPSCSIKTHIPPSAISGLSIHFFTTFEIPSIVVGKILFIDVDLALIYSSLEFLPCKPRDPPLS